MQQSTYNHQMPHQVSVDKATSLQVLHGSTNLSGHVQNDFRLLDKLLALSQELQQTAYTGTGGVYIMNNS